ncbi:MAG: hypothetical protein HKO62_13190, partial [Gammaproteobacteria bacterium]|nr:hypothetical protein [Gammaproteobacteria bacterium]
IDGGQTFGDLQLLLVELERALRATLDDEARLARLVEAVFDGHATKAQAAELAEELDSAWQQRRIELDQAETSSKYGYTRLDAFGNILNRSLLLAGGEGNRIEPNAPVSYPYLWDTPQHDYVEWNGSSPNPQEGALARNVGEVIGVFGSVDVAHKYRRLGLLDGGYQSSVNTRNLRRLEQHIAKLTSPQWADFLPPIDAALAGRGRALYEQHCIACHEDIERASPDRMVRVQMASLEAIGTDPLMARNAVMLTGKTGRFEGEPRFYLAGEELGAEAPVLYVANHIMGGVLKNNFLDILFAQREASRMGHTVRHPPKYLDGAVMPDGEAVSERALLAYKARPLNGVWTSAPYLHNGSVANMYQLMLPAEERYQSFHVGSREFDAAVLGFSTRASADSFLFDTALPGNSNAGHEYGTGAYGQPRLSHDEILAVIEYVKTL